MIKTIKTYLKNKFNKNQYTSNNILNKVLDTEFILDNNIHVYIISTNIKEKNLKVLLKRNTKEIQV